MHLFEYESYKAALKDAVLEKKAHLGLHYTFQKMAVACRIEKTYLSRVLNDTSHLSLEQLYLACAYLGFNADQQHYMQILLQLERASESPYKTNLKSELERVRIRLATTEQHIKSTSLSPDSPEMIEYFLLPEAQIVHMFLTIPRFAEDLRLISESLRISMERLLELMRKLEALGFIQLRDGLYRVVKNDMHFSSESRYFEAYRLASRMRSLQRQQQLSREEGYSFSVSFSSTPEVQARIRGEFMKLLSKIESWVKEGGEEEVYQMNFDLFPWS